jgi:hypothetical protein
VLGFNAKTMSTRPDPIHVPPPAEIREQLAAVVAEARALRRLLRLAEAASRVEKAHKRNRRPFTGEEGPTDA